MDLPVKFEYNRYLRALATRHSVTAFLLFLKIEATSPSFRCTSKGSTVIVSFVGNQYQTIVNTTAVIGIIAGILTSSSLIPQLIKIIKEKKVENLSKGMFFTLLTGVVMWIVYGIMRDDLPIIDTNAFSALLNVCILILRFRYRKR
jgi:MtN3 and saliva related transmembrane protein